ncbi:MAG: glutamine synthetase III [Clostridia bacterium]|nr:glutamine synthetase III [Clostridia bacterium]MBQ6530550.1 glutamine synthetase III [Clostridia bacterium]
MNVVEIFGSKVFNLPTMKERLPKDIYKSLVKTINDGSKLDLNVANAVAHAMKEWALENGCTHYTHWFQPMTGLTAEKHDSFIQPTDDRTVVMEFSGKELVMGEPDASSFPSGGLRATFEARGYTAWDPTSFAFIKGTTLYIPTSFVSYTGEVLDKKTPLLKSDVAIEKAAKRVLALFGKHPKRVVAYVGPEQEYFLVDKNLRNKRKDLLLTGRTLFGAKPAKGQEMDDHYFGQIKERVAAFMSEVDEELWKLGVLAKTKHNEVAPAQHEIAPIFSTTNISTDHNQLTMEILKTVAEHHDLYCLLHEKPYEGINGSGKHNNWSLGTSDGELLFKPGDKPEENLQFLVFLAAVIKAVDDYADILRASVATAGNDHRLGANEAPPAIISMYLGDQLAAVVDRLKKHKSVKSVSGEQIETGVDALPDIKKDTTDRNRTSPFAFTGNRFEFRAPGSRQSVAGINIVINTIVAETLTEIADELEGSKDFKNDAFELATRIFAEHDRIIFNGNGYSDEWVKEAERRGLDNLKTTPEALPRFVSQKSIDVFTKQEVLTEIEVKTRGEIMMEEYNNTLHFEMLTMLEMAKQEILPACLKYTKFVTDDIASKKAIGLDAPNETDRARTLTSLTEELITRIDTLDKASEKVGGEDAYAIGMYYKDTVVPAMDALRETADTLETMVSKEYWPFPTYTDLLYYV